MYVSCQHSKLFSDLFGSNFFIYISNKRYGSLILSDLCLIGVVVMFISLRFSGVHYVYLIISNL